MAGPGKIAELQKIDFLEEFPRMLLLRETLADAKKELSSPSSVNRGKEKIKMITYV